MWCRFGGAVWQRAVSVGGPAVGLHSTRTVANAGGRPWTREQSFAALPRQHWFPKEDFAIMEDVVTDEEAAVLLKDMDRVLRRRRYEKDHWDAVIVNFRETEHSKWSLQGAAILAEMREKIQAAVATPTPLEFLPPVHILDLHEDGYIKPHVDSIKFSGGVVAGLSLLSDGIMRLRPVDAETDEPLSDSSVHADFVLRQRSLYVMSGAARYNFTHEILESSESVFDGVPVERGRRISIMFRDVLK